MPDLSNEPDMNDIFLTCIQQTAGMKDHVYYFMGKHIRYLPAAARYSFALENFMGKGVFAERKLRLKAFRSYRIPSTKQLMKPLAQWWQKRRPRSETQ
jgi:hypothetical protein